MNDAPLSRLAELVCPPCRVALEPTEAGARCPKCGVAYTRNEGILSFLSPEERFNEGRFEQNQIEAWTRSANLRDTIRRSAPLRLLNACRLRWSLSGRRDRIFLKAIAPRKKDNPLILDVGCGGGRHYFKDYGRVIGIDPVLPLLHHSAKIYDEVYQTSGFKLPFADDTFDFVVTSDVIGHIPEASKDVLFAEIFRVLRRGGQTVHCAETDSTSLWFRFAKKHPDLFQTVFVDKPGHISLELPTKLRDRFVKHGFEVKAFRRLNGTVLEPGTLAGFFDNEYKTKCRWIPPLVAVDKLLGRNLVVRELLNFALEPLAQLEDRVTHINVTSGVLAICEKPKR